MCAVCFTGLQAVPVAAVAARFWWVNRFGLGDDGDEVAAEELWSDERAPVEHRAGEHITGELDAAAPPRFESTSNRAG